MRSKSIVNIKKSWGEDIAAGRFDYGAIFAECYWRETKDGIIEESQPTTSELLNQWLWPFYPSVNGDRVYINKWFTSIRIQTLNGSGGVHIERLVYMPDVDRPELPPGFIDRECWQNFREHWAAND